MLRRSRPAPRPVEPGAYAAVHRINFLVGNLQSRPEYGTRGRRAIANAIAQLANAEYAAITPEVEVKRKWWRFESSTSLRLAKLRAQNSTTSERNRDAARTIDRLGILARFIIHSSITHNPSTNHTRYIMQFTDAANLLNASHVVDDIPGHNLTSKVTIQEGHLPAGLDGMAVSNVGTRVAERAMQLFFEEARSTPAKTS